MSNAEPVTNEPKQWVTHANIDNLFVARRLASVVDELTVFMTHSEVEAMLRRKGKTPLFLKSVET